MNDFSIVIIDNDEHTITLIKTYLAKFFPNLKLIGTSKHVEQGISMVKELQPDAVILDTHVNKHNPYHILDELKPIDVEIIIISLHKEFVLKAIKYEIADYVLKPVELDQILDAINKVIKRLRTKKYVKDLELKANVGKLQQLNIIAIPTAKEVRLENINDIVVCEAQGRYTVIHIKNKQVVTSKNLGEYEEVLKQNGFFRVHKSFLINLNRIKNIFKKDNQYYCELLDHQQPVPISKRRTESLQRYLKIKN